MKPKNIVLLGSTGSIGVSTQKVAADLPDHIRIVGMAARENVDALEKSIHQFKPLAVAMKLWLATARSSPASPPTAGAPSRMARVKPSSVSPAADKAPKR